MSEPGNLYASLLLTDPAPPEHWPELSFVAALAVHDAVVELAPGLKPRLAIKWPNDLLLSGEKFAGILIEGEGGHDGAVAVGIGVNCASHPADTDHPATDLAAAGAQVSPAGAVRRALGQDARAPGAMERAARALPPCAPIGSPAPPVVGEDIRVRLADREVSGRFEALDEAGSLVLRRADGKRETIAAGDVFIASAVSPAAGS